MLANIVGTASVLRAARAFWLEGDDRAHRFHQVSTGKVFGMCAITQSCFDVASVYAPVSPYAASKAASDHLVQAYHRTYGLETTVSHSANTYGPYQQPNRLIPSFFNNALSG